MIDGVVKKEKITMCPRCGLGIMRKSKIGPHSDLYACPRCSYIDIKEHGVIIKPKFNTV